MTGGTFSWKFLSVGSIILSCLLLMTITSGCKKEADEVRGGQKTKDIGSKGPLAFDLKEILDSDVTWPGSSLPRALKFPGKVRRAEIEIDGNEYGVFLSPHPRTDICLFPKDRPLDYQRWSRAHQLNSMHVIGKTYYRFATDSTGDKLFVRPYEGRLGTFEVGAGGRDVQEVRIGGSLHSEDTAVPIGGKLENGWPKPMKRCRVPEGDHVLADSRITLGRLQIDVSSNRHTDGQGRRPRDHSHLYAIKIREDKPYVYDFSRKPDVMFTLPAKNQQVKLGEQIQVKAVLIDPELDIMICRLADTTRKQKREYIASDGQKHTIELPTALEPKVVITRADGEKVAEGVMPFG